jgi:uroporphyrinogen-III synthase
MGVLVTRPAPQAAPLCRLIEDEGARAIAFPTVVIEPAPHPQALRAGLAAFAPVDMAIFVSPNAVLHGAALVAGLHPRPLVAAIGPATAAALGAAGLTADVQPSDGFTSEALLAESALAPPLQLRIALVRGGEGRDLLGRELRRRGADVRALDVYVRRQPFVNEHDAATLTGRWQRGEVDIVIATGVETLTNLHALLGRDAAALLKRTPILTSSARVDRAARRLGHRVPSAIAAGPDPRSLVAALADWQRRQTGRDG